MNFPSPLRRITLALSALLLSACAAPPHAPPADAPAAGSLYTIIANPGEDCSTQVNIGWHADLDSGPCRVLYSPRSDSNWSHALSAAGSGEPSDVFDGISSRTASGQDWKEEARFLNYHANLTGLRPGTDYMYRIVDARGRTSPIQYFKTAPRTGKFSFAWISDIHAYTPLPKRLQNAAAVVDATVAQKPGGVDFIFSTGDIVAWGGSYSFWKDLYSQPFLTRYLFASVIGNHDYMTRPGPGRNDFFRVANAFPTNGYTGEKGVCYWFIYDRVLFIMLNNEAMKTSPEALADAQHWAASVIDRLKGQYRLIFLAEHYQWFDGRNGKASWYEKWKEFCDQHGVSLALSGNNHIYERTHPLSGDRVVGDGEGTVYMEAPSSDGERGVEAGELTTNADKLAYTWSSHTHSNKTEVRTIGCVLVEIEGDKISTKLVYLDDNGAVHTADPHTFRARPLAKP